ncbi:C40 family peptidase [Clostridium intestinale]|uniref:Endopeptidase LytF n=1 Tax=Clostridium intestinale URNW TaxID=1294142 RepID=U2Q031_9CLOT|nr:C40 family peptidase [Clostridium intestinale]ERK32100.1 endopeptidase LytF [Clostridium intestinale URNW]
MNKRGKIITKTLLLTMSLITATSFNAIKTKADTTGNAAQGVVLKTTQLKVQKTIVAPKKDESGSYSGGSLSRGSGGAGGNVVSYAYNFIGRPYVYGAAGPKSFDCSGLTMYVYSKFGYSLPHYTGSQFSMGSAVSRANLSAGDLVFFNTYGSISHVGIYIGGGDFIHAPSSGKNVTISSLNDSYYSSRYAGGRRIAQ